MLTVVFTNWEDKQNCLYDGSSSIKKVTAQAEIIHIGKDIIINIDFGDSEVENFEGRTENNLIGAMREDAFSVTLLTCKVAPNHRLISGNFVFCDSNYYPDADTGGVRFWLRRNSY